MHLLLKVTVKIFDFATGTFTECNYVGYIHKNKMEELHLQWLHSNSGDPTALLLRSMTNN